MIHERINRLNRLIANTDDFVLAELKHLIHTDCRIFNGEYADRIGRIDGIIIDNKEVRFLVHPYKMDTKGNLTNVILYDRPDARRYWSVREIEIFADK